MKKSSNGQITVIVILLICLSCTSVYICYDKFLKNDILESDNLKNNQEKENNTAPEEKEQTIATNSRLVKYLYNKVVDTSVESNPYWMYGESDNFTVQTAPEEQKMYLVGINLVKSKETTPDCNNVPTKDGGYSSSCNTNPKAYKKSYIEYIYKELFGPDATFSTSADIQTSRQGLEIYKYIQSNDSYVKYTIEGGGTQSGKYTSQITKAIKKDQEIKIYETITISDINETHSESKYIYTFTKDNDEMYHFISRVKE